jgi:hypothetical protein
LALRDYLSEANLNSTLTLCTEPEHLKGKSWSRLAAEDFACKPLIDVNEPHVEGRLGFDVTFSCRVSGNPPPTIWWVLQNRQVKMFSRLYISFVNKLLWGKSQNSFPFYHSYEREISEETREE